MDLVSGDTVMAYLEMLAGVQAPLPDLVRVAVMRAVGGDRLLTVTADLTPIDPASTAWFVARAVLPTATLPPGRYVASAEVMSAGSLVARVVRPFSIPD